MRKSERKRRRKELKERENGKRKAKLEAVEK